MKVLFITIGICTGLELDYDVATTKDELAEALAQIRPWATAA